MDAIDEDEIRSLEQLRGRVYQLYRAFSTLHTDIAAGRMAPESLPLQLQTTIALKALQGVSETLSRNEKLLASLVAYPLPQFPGRYYEAELQNMLRTRLETRVEDWVAHGTELAGSLTADGHSLNPEKLRHLWNWAAPEANEIAQQNIFFHNYTAAEKETGIENVVTGLKQQPIDDTEEDGSEEDNEGDEEEDHDEENTDDQDKMKTSDGSQRKSTSKPSATAAPHVPPIPIDKVLRFVTTGAMPS